MGIKGDKETSGSATMADLLLDKLSAIGNVTSKKMFGGHGIFHDGKMFGIVDSKGNAFLKVGDSNRSDFEAGGAIAHGKMPYMSIPDEVLEDDNKLIDWSQKSIQL